MPTRTDAEQFTPAIMSDCKAGQFVWWKNIRGFELARVARVTFRARKLWVSIEWVKPDGSFGLPFEVRLAELHIETASRPQWCVMARKDGEVWYQVDRTHTEESAILRASQLAAIDETREYKVEHK